ncbi:MAG: DoxX family protein [Nitrospina sp.]|jgi:putative oxidoreductase|nr:DoxX family protein [Nitrospina sp.]MBT3507925.1 DoxX family protein [Nitrospina sp.]MBT3876451.1 DoxX family protein [Nitrospina sp.]MBT4048728.1 DoxX family protein [Nitrospina sp.]MBT4558037.1 DoxX family protein [Nitrospina sp.]
MRAFFQTDENINNLIIRVMLGMVMFPHGAQKLLGWFGGYGLEGTLGFFTNQMGVPMVIAVLVILGESLGALGLITGFLTRFCAAGVLMIMSGAVVMSHAANGFFMNWSGKQGGEGFEYHILAIGLCLPLLISGGGRFSADGFIVKRFSLLLGGNK